jgi:transforming growth factor-beta-induced protein
VLGEEKDASIVNGVSTTLQGSTVNVNVPSINSGAATITQANINADGGVIHKIDSVLIPPGFTTDTVADLAVASGLTTLVSALSTVGAVSTFSSPGVYTVFAPTDEAFQAFFDKYDASLELFQADATLQKYLARLLNAHVVPDKALFLSDVASMKAVKTLSGKVRTRDISPVITDVEALNGVVHVVDEVIITRVCRRGLRSAIKKAKKNFQGQNPQNPQGPDAQPEQSIAALASATADLSTLVAALGAADLVGAVTDESATLTVFAPLNSAFDAIADIVGFLLIDTGYTKDLLKQLLLFHVLPKKATKADLEAVSTETTLSGVSLAVDIPNVNGDSSVQAADVMASNGVVHIIDKVMVPPGFPTSTIAELAGATPTLSTLVAVLSAYGLVPVFGENTGTVYTVFAPTDTAFANLLGSLGLGNDLAAALATIVGDQKLKSMFKQVLGYHYVAGRALNANAVTNTKKIQTASGKLNNHVFLNKLVATDINALNGRVHVIKSVIAPKWLRRRIQNRLKAIRRG